jgi:hypothetical protein
VQRSGDWSIVGEEVRRETKQLSGGAPDQIFLRLRAGQEVFDLPASDVKPQLLQDLYAQEAPPESAPPLDAPAAAPRAVAMTCR